MIQSKSKVNHPQYGNGTVVSVDAYGATCMVDFKGRLRHLKTSSLQIGHILRVGDVNELKPKSSVLNAIEELKAKYSRNDVAVGVLNELKGML